MALPISVPYAFANATTTQNLSYLDADFAAVYNAVNGIGNGTVSLSNVNITGGNISASYSANSISIASLQTTGTANVNTYLRGDGSWATVSGGGGGGGAAANVFYVSSNTLSQNYTLATGNNAVTAGPLTIATGITLNVATGARLVVV